MVSLSCEISSSSSMILRKSMYSLGVISPRPIILRHLRMTRLSIGITAAFADCSNSGIYLGL